MLAPAASHFFMAAQTMRARLVARPPQLKLPRSLTRMPIQG